MNSLLFDPMLLSRSLLSDRRPGVFDLTPRWSLDAEGLEARMLVPGINPADVRVSHQGRALTVSISHHESERSWSWTIAPDFDLDQAVARVSRGVLTLSVPRRPADPVVPVAVVDLDGMVDKALSPEAASAAGPEAGNAGASGSESKSAE